MAVLAPGDLKSEDLGEILDLPVDLGRLERRVAKSSNLDHGASASGCTRRGARPGSG